MRYKTLFRLGLKLVGVMQIAQWLGSFIMTSIYLIHSGTQQWTSWSQYFAALGGVHAQAVVQVAIGLYLFFGGRWIADKAIPGNRPYCPECGYDLTSSLSPTCPECGTRVAADHRGEPPPPPTVST